MIYQIFGAKQAKRVFKLHFLTNSIFLQSILCFAIISVLFDVRQNKMQFSDVFGCVFEAISSNVISFLGSHSSAWCQVVLIGIFLFFYRIHKVLSAD